MRQRDLEQVKQWLRENHFTFFIMNNNTCENWDGSDAEHRKLLLLFHSLQKLATELNDKKMLNLADRVAKLLMDYID